MPSRYTIMHKTVIGAAIAAALCAPIAQGATYTQNAPYSAGMSPTIPSGAEFHRDHYDRIRALLMGVRQGFAYGVRPGASFDGLGSPRGTVYVCHGLNVTAPDRHGSWRILGGQ